MDRVPIRPRVLAAEALAILERAAADKVDMATASLRRSVPLQKLLEDAGDGEGAEFIAVIRRRALFLAEHMALLCDQGLDDDEAAAQTAERVQAAADMLEGMSAATDQ